MMQEISTSLNSLVRNVLQNPVKAEGLGTRHLNSRMLNIAAIQLAWENPESSALKVLALAILNAEPDNSTKIDYQASQLLKFKHLMKRRAEGEPTTNQDRNTRKTGISILRSLTQ